MMMMMMIYLFRNASAATRIDHAHRYYMTVDNKDAHDQMADIQVFHACVRLYEVMNTVRMSVLFVYHDDKDFFHICGSFFWAKTLLIHLFRSLVCH